MEDKNGMKQPSGEIWGSVSYPRTLEMQTGGAGDRTTDFLIGRRPLAKVFSLLYFI